MATGLFFYNVCKKGKREKMRKRRFSTVAIAGCLALSMAFSGCAKKSEGDTSAASTEAATSVSTEAGTAASTEGGTSADEKITMENIRNYVDYGISVLGLPTPDSIDHYTGAYFPNNYVQPKTLKELVGEYEGNETDYLVKIIRQIHRQPLLLHLIEFTRELLRDTVNDDQLTEALEEKRLLNYTRSLMQVLGEQTQIDEGYMPVEPLDNRQTQQIRKHLANHLKI